jgi:hypothetical protein
MIQLPKSIVRKIISYVDIVTFTQYPIQMLQLLTIGIKNEHSEQNACKYRKEIFNDYCDRILKNSSLKSIDHILLCCNIVFDDMVNYKLNECPAKTDDMKNHIINRWSSLKNERFALKEDSLKIQTIISGQLLVTVYTSYSYNMPSLCPYNDEREECLICRSPIENNTCSGLEKRHHNTVLVGYFSQETKDNLISLMSYLINLIKIRKLEVEANVQ